MKFIYIVGCVFFTVLGQLFIKSGAIELKGSNSLFAYLFNGFIIAGLSLAALAAGSWIKAMQYYDLSYAYPFMSLSFLLVALLSIPVFGETVKGNQWIGLGIVIVGLYIGSR
jgi:drug/metabolite transporter (DMT)-like permease